MCKYICVPFRTAEGIYFKLSLSLLIKKKNACVYFSLKQNIGTVQKCTGRYLHPQSDVWPTGTHRQRKVQTQDGTEMLQIKKLFKPDCLKAG